MILLLETLLALGLIAQALVGLAFFISCCWEGERRAALWAGVQAAAMLAAAVLFLYLWHSGFFSPGCGGFRFTPLAIESVVDIETNLCTINQPNRKEMTVKSYGGCVG